MLNQIPRPLLVAGVLFIGVMMFFVLQEPTSVCDIQMTRLNEKLAGHVLPSNQKGVIRPPILLKTLANCRLSNTPGACYEYFEVLRRMVREIKAGAPTCYPKFFSNADVSATTRTAIEIMSQIAWGDSPPETGRAKFGWLESADLALFCDLKDLLVGAAGEGALETLRNTTYASLPGEAPKIIDGKCANCDYRKTATEVLATEEIWVKSLFSIRCEAVR